MLPEAIRSRLNELGDHKAMAVSPVSVGDVRRANGSGGSRLVVVLSLDEIAGSTEVALIHSYAEYATEDDVVVPTSVTELRYELVAQGDLCGQVWIRDLGAVIATVPLTVVEALLGRDEELRSNAGSNSGLPLIGPFDARWDFKLSEGDELRGLTAEAMSALLDDGLSLGFGFGGDAWCLEFDEISSEILRPALDAEQLIATMYELWTEHGATLELTINQLMLRGDSRLLEEDEYTATLGSVGTLFHAAVIEPLIERARSTYGSHAEVVPPATIGVEDLRRLQNA